MFELSEDHETFRKVVREFAEAEVAPHVAEWDRDHHFPVELIGKMGDLGLFGLVVARGVRRLAAATSRRCASRSRSSAGSTSRSASPSQPASAWASTRS